MANIVEFTSPAGTLRPDGEAANVARESGFVQNRMAREAGSAFGRGISVLGQPIQQAADKAEDHAASQLIGHGSATASALWADMTKQLNDVMNNADPNDTSVGQGFREKVVDASIDNFTKQFDNAPKRAQDWALATADRMRDHFYKTITADEVTRAHAAVTQNVGDTFKNLSQSADLNPTGLPDYVDQLRATSDALIASHSLSVEGAAQVRKEAKGMEAHLALSAIKGAARNNPQGAIDAINEGKFNPYMDALQQDQALKYAEGVKKDQQAQADHAKVIARQDRIDASEKSKDKYVTAGLNGKPMGDYANDSTLTAEAKENLRSFQHALVTQAQDRSENTPHPTEWRNLITQLHDTAVTDPNNISDKPIYDLLKAGKLNKAEFGQALSIFKSIDSPLERNIETQMKRVETFAQSSIDGKTLKMLDSNAYVDTLNRFELEGRQRIALAKSKGEDLTPLVDPTSKDFVFSPARFAAMLSPVKDQVQTAADAVRAKEAPTLTIREQWMQATGGAIPAGKNEAQAIEDFQKTNGGAPAITKTRDQVQKGDQYRAPDGSIRTKGGG